MNELMNKHAVTLLVCSQTSTVALALRAESRVFDSLTRLARSPVTKGNKKEVAVEDYYLQKWAKCSKFLLTSLPAQLTYK